MKKEKDIRISLPIKYHAGLKKKANKQGLESKREQARLIIMRELIKEKLVRPSKAELKACGVGAEKDYKGWSNEQMEQARLALKAGVDISHLDHEKWDWKKMEQARFALEAGFDISHLDPKLWSWEQMWQARLALKEGADISQLDPEQWDWEQMEEERMKLLKEKEGE